MLFGAVYFETNRLGTMSEASVATTLPSIQLSFPPQYLDQSPPNTITKRGLQAER